MTAHRWLIVLLVACPLGLLTMCAGAGVIVFFTPTVVSAPTDPPIGPAVGSPSDPGGVAARLGIPPVALDAYVKAVAWPDACPGARWQIIAAVNVIESGHGTHGSSRPVEVDDPARGLKRGDVYPPIVNEIGAVGPGQFMPYSWPSYRKDGNGDGVEDPQNLYDAARATLHHLCSSAGGNLLTEAAIYRGMAGYYGGDVDGYPSRGAHYLAEYDAGSAQPELPSQPFAPYAWRQPCEGPVTSGFGPRVAPIPGASTFHRGVDMGCPYGTPVVAARAGVVIAAADWGNAGLAVEVDHGGGESTRYFHLSAFAVREGQQVAAGQPVGEVGTTGNSSGPHLHFETWRGGEAVDPLGVLP